MSDHGKTTETTRTSGPIPKGMNVGDIIKWAKSNPWVLVIAALGGGKGGEQVLAEIGQRVEWWWIALAVVGIGVLNYMTESAKRNERMASKVDRVADALTGIQADLRVGAEKFTHLEADVASLKQWRHELTADKKPKSKPGMRSHPGEAR